MNKLEKFAEMDKLPNVIQADFSEVFRTDYKLKGRWSAEFLATPILLFWNLVVAGENILLRLPGNIRTRILLGWTSKGQECTMEQVLRTKRV